MAHFYTRFSGLLDPSILNIRPGVMSGVSSSTHDDPLYLDGLSSSIITAGLGDKAKGHRLYAWMKQENVQIMFLQETHFNVDSEKESNLSYGKPLSKREQKRRPKPKDRSILICQVCGDRALGYNFDAITCESCKAFFRRNALKNKSFACSFDGNCKLDAHTRKFCSGCRLKKCFNIGMKKDWILTDQQLEKRRKKNKSLQPYEEQNHQRPNHQLSSPENEESIVSSVASSVDNLYEPSYTSVTGASSCGESTTCSPLSDSCKTPPSEFSLVHTPLSDHVGLVHTPLSDHVGLAHTPPSDHVGLAHTPQSDHGLLTMVKLENMVEDDFIYPLSEQVRTSIEEVTSIYRAVFDAPYNMDQESKLQEHVRSADQLFNMTDMFIKRLIKFAKTIPEFRGMKQEDQIALLKGGVMEIMYLRSAMGFDERRKSWMYKGAKGKGELKADVLHSLQEDNFSDHITFVMGLHNLCRNDHVIMILLFVIELFSPDRPNLKNKEVVSAVQEKFSSWMRLYLESVYPQSEARSLYPKLLMKLTDVRTLGESSSQMAAQLDISRMEPLLVEVFNLKH